MYNIDTIDILNNINLLLRDYKPPFKDFYFAVENELQKLRKNEKTNNILITQLNAMGDLALASGAIREIRKNYPNSHITLVCLGLWTPLVINCPYVDRIISSFIKDDTLITTLNNVPYFCFTKLWDRSYDFAINLHWGQCGHCASFINWFSGAKERYGFDLYTEQKLCNDSFSTGYFTEDDDYSFILTRSFNAPKALYRDVERKYWLLNQIGVKVTDKTLELWLTDADHVEINSSNKKKIIVGLGASTNNKKYSLRKLSKVLAEINKIDNVDFILVGGDTDIADADFLINKNPDLHFINYVNKLNVRQTADVIRQCDLYLGNDTGTIHMAKIYDLPTISMIRESKDVVKHPHKGTISSYLRFSPWQYNCKNRSIVLRPEHALGECNDSDDHGGCIHKQAHCINQITPEEIVEAYKSLS